MPMPAAVNQLLGRRGSYSPIEAEARAIKEGRVSKGNKLLSRRFRQAAGRLSREVRRILTPRQKYVLLEKIKQGDTVNHREFSVGLTKPARDVSLKNPPPVICSFEDNFVEKGVALTKPARDVSLKNPPPVICSFEDNFVEKGVALTKPARDVSLKNPPPVTCSFEDNFVEKGVALTKPARDVSLKNPPPVTCSFEDNFVGPAKHLEDPFADLDMDSSIVEGFLSRTQSRSPRG